MLNRILGRTKAKDLTSEEIQKVAGAGCHTTYYDTWVCYGLSGTNPDESCPGPMTNIGDQYTVCN
jgi:hypothetical protein